MTGSGHESARAGAVVEFHVKSARPLLPAWLWAWAVCAAGAVVGTSGCRHAPPPQYIGVTVVRPADRVTVSGSPMTPVVTVSSATGIGTLVMCKTADQWPDSVRIRLRYADGRPFVRLEQVTLEAGPLSCTTARGRPDTIPCAVHGTGGHDTLRVALSVRRGDESLIVNIPARAAATESDTIRVFWVDVFR